MPKAKSDLKIQKQPSKAVFISVMLSGFFIYVLTGIESILAPHKGI